LHNGDVLLPSAEKVQEELSKQIENELSYCLDDLKPFASQGYTITEAEPKIETTIGLKTTIVRMNYPVTISKRDSSYKLEPILYKIEYGLLDKYQIVEEFVNEDAKDPEYMAIGKLIDLAYEHGFTYTSHYAGENAMQFDLIFENPIPRSDEPFVYSFAMHYSWNLREGYVNG